MPYLNADLQREFQRNWMKRRRDEWIESKGGVCALCGSDDRLEVDHIDRSTKEFYPRDIWSRRAEVRHAELAKCQVLCRTCHESKSWNELVSPVHGTSGWYNRGCRCVDCRAYNARKRREWRARKRAEVK